MSLTGIDWSEPACTATDINKASVTSKVGPFMPATMTAVAILVNRRMINDLNLRIGGWHQEAVHNLRYRIGVLRIGGHLLPGGVLAEHAPMLVVSFAVFSREHVGQVRQVGADEGLAKKDRAHANLAHEVDLAAVEHFDFLGSLGFAVALVGADFEHARLLFGGVGWDL